MVTERDVELPDGRTLHAYDTGATADPGLTVVWHHGTPALGAPPRPLFPLSEELGIRWVSYDRPGYGGSSPNPGRDVGTAARDVAAVADALGLDRFAVMGHSGGGPHALACAALLPDRVVAAVVLAGLAPLDADGLHWFAGMEADEVGALRASIEGPAARTNHEAMFGPRRLPLSPSDATAVATDWGWLTEVTDPARVEGQEGQVDDDLALVAYWGFEPSVIAVPTLVVQGAQDRVVPLAHGEWLAAAVPGADLWVHDADGHVAILSRATDALRWLVESTA